MERREPLLDVVEVERADLFAITGVVSEGFSGGGQRLLPELVRLIRLPAEFNRGISFGVSIPPFSRSGPGVAKVVLTTPGIRVSEFFANSELFTTPERSIVYLLLLS